MTAPAPTRPEPIVKLYTPEILGLATSLAAYPLGADLALRGAARSPSCGSQLTVGLALDDTGAVTKLGLAAQACAVGQAAAAIMAASATGRGRDAFAAALLHIEAWLGAGGPQPDWPGMAVLAPAVAYPGRHGAILLGWRAALAAFDAAAHS